MKFCQTMTIITEVKGNFLERCIEVKHKVVIKILQGRVVAMQTVLGGLTIHHPVANFL